MTNVQKTTKVLTRTIKRRNEGFAEKLEPTWGLRNPKSKIESSLGSG